MLSTSNNWLHICVSIQSTGCWAFCSNILCCIALDASVILVGKFLIILNQFNLIVSEYFDMHCLQDTYFLLGLFLPVNRKIG